MAAFVRLLGLDRHVRPGSFLAVSGQVRSDATQLYAHEMEAVRTRIGKVVFCEGTPGPIGQRSEGLVGLLVEGVLAPNSRLIGHTLQEKQFKSTFDVVALALRRHGKIIRQKIGKVRLTFGDSLLLQGDRQQMERLKDSGDFLLMEHVKLRYSLL